MPDDEYEHPEMTGVGTVTNTLTAVSQSTGAEPESRAARKERTRKALLDGTLELMADRSFAA